MFNSPRTSAAMLALILLSPAAALAGGAATRPAGSDTAAGTERQASSREAEPATPLTLQQAFEKHRRFLLVLNMDDRRGSQRAEWFDKFLRQWATDPSVRSPTDLRDALMHATHLGRHSHLFFRDTGYVRQKEVVELLVAALRDADPKTHEYATIRLANECYHADLEAHSQEILQILKEPRPGEEWGLYGRLQLTEEERKKLANSGNRGIDDEIRARAGNEAIEKRLIREFEEATEYFAKAKLARQLGYIGTKGCAEALAKGLRSEVSVRGAANEVAVRLDVLLALGRIYQDEPLFTRDALHLRQSSDGQFDVYRGMEEYHREVNEWVKRHFGHEAWGTGTVWFARPTYTPTTRGRDPQADPA